MDRIPVYSGSGLVRFHCNTELLLKAPFGKGKRHKDEIKKNRKSVIIEKQTCGQKKKNQRYI